MHLVATKFLLSSKHVTLYFSILLILIIIDINNFLSEILTVITSNIKKTTK